MNIMNRLEKITCTTTNIKNTAILLSSVCVAAVLKEHLFIPVKYDIELNSGYLEHLN